MAEMDVLKTRLGHQNPDVEAEWLILSLVHPSAGVHEFATISSFRRRFEMLEPNLCLRER